MSQLDLVKQIMVEYLMDMVSNLAVVDELEIDLIYIVAAAVVE